tara:strand:- start:841 stop:1500 length:660 start_codon:yes stop_codon:yes gene_type:complete
MDVNNFDQEYKNYTIEWINIKNNQSNIFIDPNDFYAEICIHLFVKDKIKLYNDGQVKFKTWLNAVLMNFYLNLINKQKAQKVFKYDSLDEMQEDTGFELGAELEDTDESGSIQKIIKKFNQLEPIGARVLLKLKYYVYDLIDFSKEELEYMSGHYKGDLKVMDYINKVSANIDDPNKRIRKDKGGLRKEEIAELTEYAVGSINTMAKRFVTKLKINLYK